MNNRQQATSKIADFLKSDRRILLLTGTHQFEKHKLILHEIAAEVSSPSSILFRANSMQNLGSFFKKASTVLRTGTAYPFGRHELFFDAINSSSWRKTYHEYDFAILYPIDSVLKMKNKNDVLNDLCIDRRIGKIFIVSWTDHEHDDYTCFDRYKIDERVIFDAEEEDPEYHARVLDHSK